MTSCFLFSQTTVNSVQGVVAQNQSLVQCIINTSTILSLNTKAEDTMYQITIINGTTNGECLQIPAVYLGLSVA